MVTSQNQSLLPLASRHWLCHCHGSHWGSGGDGQESVPLSYSSLKVKSLSHVWLFATPLTVVHGILQARILEYKNGLPCPPPADLPDLGVEPKSLMSPASAGRFFTTSATWEALTIYIIGIQKFWRRKWQPTPVFLPGESQGRGSLVGCRLRGRTESDTTEVT